MVTNLINLLVCKHVHLIFSCRFTPVGVASLLARTIASSADTSAEFRHLGMFIATALLGFALWSLAVVPLVYFIIYRTNPFRFLFTLVEPVLITFATSST